MAADPELRELALRIINKVDEIATDEDGHVDERADLPGTVHTWIWNFIYGHTGGRLKAITAERDEARDWVRRMHAEQQVLTCAFCGEAYPPGTAASGAPALVAHVEKCPKHPLAIRTQLLRKAFRHWGAPSIAAGDDRGPVAVDRAQTREAIRALLVELDGRIVDPIPPDPATCAWHGTGWIPGCAGCSAALIGRKEATSKVGLPHG